MKIRYHVAVNNRLQRSVVSLDVTGSQLLRRIVHLVRPEDGSPLPSLSTPLWQERIHTHEWHNIINPERVAILEKAFLAELIAQADHPAPSQDANGAWRNENLSMPIGNPCV